MHMILTVTRPTPFKQKMEHLQSIGRKGNKAGEFDRPRSLAITSEGNIVVADTGNQRVQVIVI